MNFISVLPSPPLRIPSPPIRRAKKGHAGALQTFSLWGWGGNGLAVRQNSHSPSLTNPGERSSSPSLPYAIDIWFLPGERLYWQQAMKNEGAIGLKHRSCFRVAAVPTLATWGATIRRIILDDLLFLKARRQGRREDVKWHGVHLLWEWETRTTINGLDIVSEGGHDNDMSTDRRDVMPGCMGEEENESRQEGRMGGRITRLLQQSNRDN